MLKKKILVTGATGFLGRRLVRLINHKGYEVFCITRRKLPGGDLSPSKNVNYVYGLLEEPETISSYFKNIYACIHLAAETKSSNKRTNYISNVSVTRNIISLCKKNAVKKIIFTSSINTRFKRLGIYGKTKLEAENLIKNSGVNYVILLPTQIYGEGDWGLSKTMGLIKKLPFIPIIGNGKGKRQPVYVDDVACAIIASLKPDIKNKTYYLGGPEVFTFNEYIDVISKRLNIRKVKLHLPFALFYYPAKLSTRFTNKFPINVEQCLSIAQDRNGDITHAKKDLGYNPIDFKKGLDLVLGGE